jgi:hypothetical protein
MFTSIGPLEPSIKGNWANDGGGGEKKAIFAREMAMMVRIILIYLSIFFMVVSRKSERLAGFCYINVSVRGE